MAPCEEDTPAEDVPDDKVPDDDVSCDDVPVEADAPENVDRDDESDVTGPEAAADEDAGSTPEEGVDTPVPDDAPEEEATRMPDEEAAIHEDPGASEVAEMLPALPAPPDTAVTFPHPAPRQRSAHVPSSLHTCEPAQSALEVQRNVPGGTTQPTPPAHSAMRNTVDMARGRLARGIRR